MGPLTFNSQSYPQLKQTWSFSLLPPSSSPAYSLSQNLKPKLMPSHGWLTLTWDMPDGHTPLDMLPTQPPMDLDTTDTLLDPLEGTTICATGGPNSLAVIAMAEEGGFLNAP